MKSILYLILFILSDIIAKDDVLANFMPFISNTINSNDINTRQASLMAFSAMLEGPNPEVLKPLIN